MQHSLLKRLLSHISEIHVEGSSSEYNEQLDVVLSRGRYQLATKNAIYSHGDLYSNFHKAFQLVEIAKQPIQDVLILGLGLGSIPYMLEKNFNQTYHYTAIEIDEEVVYLANKYVLQYLKSSISTICSDALTYLPMLEEQYDLITMDIFIDDYVPIAFESLDFLRLLKSKLRPNGLLLFNRLYLTGQDKIKTKGFFDDKFRAVFPKGKYLDVDGNWILVGKG